MNAIQQLVKTVLEEVDGDDIQAAKDLALRRVQGDATLLAAFVQWAVGVAIDAEWRAGRAARWQSQDRDVSVNEPAFGGGVSTPSPALLHGMRHEIARAKQRLMDYEMEPGKRFGDCNASDIERAETRLRKQAGTMNLRADYMRSARGLLPDRTTLVKDVLREADLQRLHRRVTRQSEAA